MLVDLGEDLSVVVRMRLTTESNSPQKFNSRGQEPARQPFITIIRQMSRCSWHHATDNSRQGWIASSICRKYCRETCNLSLGCANSRQHLWIEYSVWASGTMSTRLWSVGRGINQRCLKSEHLFYCSSVQAPAAAKRAGSFRKDPGTFPCTMTPRGARFVKARG